MKLPCLYLNVLSEGYIAGKMKSQEQLVDSSSSHAKSPTSARSGSTVPVEHRWVNVHKLPQIDMCGLWGDLVECLR